MTLSVFSRELLLRDDQDEEGREEERRDGFPLTSTPGAKRDEGA